MGKKKTVEVCIPKASISFQFTYHLLYIGSWTFESSFHFLVSWYLFCTWIICVHFVHSNIYTHLQELTMPAGSHGSLSLLFVIKVMLRYFVSDSHKVRIALIVVLPPKCCGDFSAIPWIWIMHIACTHIMLDYVKLIFCSYCVNWNH